MKHFQIRTTANNKKQKLQSRVLRWVTRICITCQEIERNSSVRWPKKKRFMLSKTSRDHKEDKFKVIKDTSNYIWRVDRCRRQEQEARRQMTFSREPSQSRLREANPWQPWIGCSISSSRNWRMNRHQFSNLILSANRARIKRRMLLGL